MKASRQQWQKRVQRWVDSGLTAEEFAAEMGINANSLRCWKSLLKRQAQPLPKPPAPPTPAASDPEPALPLIELCTTASLTDPRFELELGPRCRLRVPPRFEAQSLRQLLALLQELP